VGAGPAGITAALEYQRRGYRDVVLLERSSRIGGRCLTTERGSDLGAVAWVPWYFDEVTAFSDELGVERDWVPLPVTYSTDAGRAVWAYSVRRLARAGVEGLRYLARHALHWQGVSGPSILRVSPELQQSYRDFLRAERFESLGDTGRVQTSGYGYRWDAPAVYNVRYVAPRSIVGVGLSLLRPRWLGGGTGLGFWKGGTQQIWEKAVARHRLDVRTGATITAIERRDRVVVHLAGAPQPLVFDALVLACNPKHLLGVLDATADERRLYSRYRTFDYRTYECTVTGLGDGVRLYGSLRENLEAAALNRPLVLFKRDPDRNQVVFYVNADGGAGDDAIAANIAADLRRLGARLDDVTASARFDYAPHVDSAALADDFYLELDRLQGKHRTIGVGATYTFDILAHVIPQARDVVRRHVAGELG